MDRNKAINRIQKLLALSNNNSSEAEATAALLNAQKLMVQHDIDIKDVEGNNLAADEVIEMVAAASRRLSDWKVRLAVVVANNFRCNCYIRSTNPKYSYNSTRISYEKQVIFVGQTSDANICSMVYQKALEFSDLYCNWFLLQEKLKLQRKLSRSESKNIGNTWRIGFAMGLKQKFDEQVAKNDWALVLVTPEAVVKYMEDTHGKMGKRQSSRQNIQNEDALYDGIDKGKKFGSQNQEEQKESANRGPKQLTSGA